jgi:starch-binding outer membrane protein, SusD/RagB family
MNRKKLYILALAALTWGSCKKDFLDASPVTEGTEQNFYRSKQDAQRAIVGCYDGLQVVWNGGIGFPILSEVLSDDAFGGTGNSDDLKYQMIDEFNKSRSPVNVSVLGENWSAYYRALYRCNMLISKIEQIDWAGDEALKKETESEARFLRAYLYFDMTRIWGNIPLLTTPTIEPVPQANPDDIYKQIAEDLKFAIANLTNTAYSTTWAQTNGGRVTKWAAEALMARVYLFYTGYYSKPDLAGSVTKAQALSYLEDAITNSGHDLLNSYASLWPAASGANYAKEDNMETVFAIKYTYTSSYSTGATDGNHWMVMFGIREQSIFPYGNGWGGATVSPKLWNAFSANDTRRAASITSIADEGLAFANKSKQREYTGFYNKKYSPMIREDGLPSAEDYVKGANFMINQYEDYVSIRYADVLLMAAELGSANAQSYFDKVRMRALGSNFTSLAVNQANILKERRLEFAGEGIRYWDLLRQGVTTAANTIAESVTLENGGLPVAKTISANHIIETKGLQQIPADHIGLSDGALRQNAGW